jgi:hypothetical protein
MPCLSRQEARRGERKMTNPIILCEECEYGARDCKANTKWCVLNRKTKSAVVTLQENMSTLDGMVSAFIRAIPVGQAIDVKKYPEYQTALSLQIKYNAAQKTADGWYDRDVHQ